MVRSELDVLREVEGRLERGRAEFIFSSWPSCTCGHIYTAASGRRADSDHLVMEPQGGFYLRVIERTATALGWVKNEYVIPPMSAASYVSAYTQDHRDRAFSEVDRSDALAVIRQAIKSIEDAEHAAAAEFSVTPLPPVEVVFEDLDRDLVPA